MEETDETHVKRLIMFVGVHDTLDIFMYDMKNSFEKMGYEIMLYDSSDEQNSLKELMNFIQKPVTAALTLNNQGFNMHIFEGKNIWDDLGIVCINILMDHPFCYRHTLDNAPINSIVLCPDRNHVRYLERFYPQIRAKGFFTHAGKAVPGDKKKLTQRGCDVMYAGSLSRSVAANIIPDLSGYEEMFGAGEAGVSAHGASESGVWRFCRNVYQDVIAHPEKTTEQGIEDQLIRMGVNVSDEELCRIISDFHFLDLYIVSYYRERVVATIARAGIKLDIYGTGWEECDWIDLPNVTYHGKISAEKTLLRMQDAKIVLNTMTWFKDGTHDRVFNGMLAGAVAVTDSSIYMKEEFRGELNIGEEADVAADPFAYMKRETCGELNIGEETDVAADSFAYMKRETCGELKIGEDITVETEEDCSGLGDTSAVGELRNEDAGGYDSRDGGLPELVIFELTQIESLPKKVKYLLSNLEVAQCIADNGCRRAMESETWDARAKELDRELLSYLM